MELNNFSDLCADNPCSAAQNATVTCMSINATAHQCDYQCVAENFKPIGEDAANGCTGNFKNYIQSKN